MTTTPFVEPAWFYSGSNRVAMAMLVSFDFERLAVVAHRGIHYNGCVVHNVTVG